MHEEDNSIFKNKQDGLGIFYLSNQLSKAKRTRLFASPAQLIFCGLSPFNKIGAIWKKNTELFEMIVGVLTTCHTQYTSESSICIFFI